MFGGAPAAERRLIGGEPLSYDCWRFFNSPACTSCAILSPAPGAAPAGVFSAVVATAFPRRPSLDRPWPRAGYTTSWDRI